MRHAICVALLALLALTISPVQGNRFLDAAKGPANGQPPKNGTLVPPPNGTHPGNETFGLRPNGTKPENGTVPLPKNGTPPANGTAKPLPGNRTKASAPSKSGRLLPGKPAGKKNSSSAN